MFLRHLYVPAFVIFNLYLHGTIAAVDGPRRRTLHRQAMEPRQIRNAYYNNNGPLPKTWDATNNQTMASVPADASAKTPRSLMPDSSKLKSRQDVVDDGHKSVRPRDPSKHSLKISSPEHLTPRKATYPHTASHDFNNRGISPTDSHNRDKGKRAHLAPN